MHSIVKHKASGCRLKQHFAQRNYIGNTIMPLSLFCANSLLHLAHCIVADCAHVQIFGEEGGREGERERERVREKIRIFRY